MKTTSYWLDEESDQASRSATAPVGTRSGAAVDVVVVGGGVTGCSCALTLARGGLRVRLREAREIAGGASGRNGGFALRGGAMAYDVARTTLGVDRARLLWQLTERSLERLAGLAGDASSGPVGSLRFAADAPSETASHASSTRSARTASPPTGSSRSPRRSTGLYCGALVTPGDGTIDPVRWVRRLAQHAVEAGAEIVEHTRVDSPASSTQPRSSSRSTA